MQIDNITRAGLIANAIQYAAFPPTPHRDPHFQPYHTDRLMVLASALRQRMESRTAAGEIRHIIRQWYTPTTEAK